MLLLLLDHEQADFYRIAGGLYDARSHEEQQAAIESYLRWRNGERPLDILDWETYYWQVKRTG